MLATVNVCLTAATEIIYQSKTTLSDRIDFEIDDAILFLSRNEQQPFSRKVGPK